MKNLDKITLESSVSELTDVETLTIVGGDSFWSRVGQAVGYVVGSIVKDLQNEADIYYRDPELYRALRTR